MDRFFFVAGSLLAFLAVALGAFAAHSLKARLPADMLNIFETGVRYHMYHALALLAVAWAASRWPESSAATAGWAFIFGIVDLFGEPLHFELHGNTLAWGHHTYRWCGFSAGMATPRLGRLAVNRIWSDGIVE